MDYTEKATNPSPKLTANAFSKLTFWWLKDIYWCRKNRNISASDIYDALPEDLSDPLSKDLETAWKEEIRDARARKKDPHLWNAVIKTFRFSYFLRSFLPFCYCIISIFIIIVIFISFHISRIIQPLVLKLFMSYFHSGSTTTTLEAYLYASFMVATMAVQSFMYRHAHVMLTQTGMRVRIACSSLVFKKITRLSYLSIDQNTKGSIINLISNDVAKFDYFALALSYTLIAPLQLLVTTYLMWQDVGAVAIIGIVLMMIQSMPIQGYLYRLLKKFKPELAKRRDERISLITEIIDGIRTIKMYVWEKSFESLVYNARRREIKVQMKIAYINAAICTMNLIVDRLSAFITILIYTLINGTITAEKIVSIAQLLITLLMTLIIHCSYCIQLGADVKVSMKRIEKFLLLDEVSPYIKKIESQNNRVAVSIKKASVAPGGAVDSKTKILQDISIDFNSNMLHTITGLVGGGKSTLLKLMLGEFPPISGTVSVHGKVAYASQEPWLFPASVRENILLGDKYDEEKYRRVTEVCALISDFSLLPYGDKTLVGEKGMALSGGQCARVNLARAIYKDADIYLLDSPLAAVDIHVNRKIFEDCINGYLKNKTRILVTHDSEHLQYADNIIVINNGMVEFQGDFPAFCKNNQHISYLPAKVQKDESTNEEEETFDNEKTVVIVAEENQEIDEKEPQESEELVAKGYVAKSVYFEYVRSSGSLFVVFIIMLIFAMSKVILAVFDYWIIAWTKKGEMDLRNYRNNATFTEDYEFIDYEYVKQSLLICGVLIGSGVVMTVIGDFLFWERSLQASKNIHNKMFSCILRTPMSFFQMNTSGRILNRFSKDVGTADEMLIKATLEATTGLISIFTIVVPILIINWWNIFAILIMGFIFTKLTKLYIFTIQAVNRQEGNAKSPVLSIGASTINGLLTVRSCGIKKTLGNIFDFQQDRHTGVVYIASCMAAANGLSLQLIVTVFFAIAAYGCLLIKDKIYASDTGYILTNVLNIATLLQYTMRQFADALAFMTNVERMVQFTKLDQENLIESETPTKIPSHWPDKGELKFDHVYLRYSEDAEPVLRNLHFTIEPRAKVGIVGRTGAGKSSLIGALFRLAKIDGSILIDGIDTKSISLFDLRSKISIIPQDPFLISGSLRTNLDPVNEFDDASLWSALDDVQLKNSFTSLECLIDKDGGNLSLGQRQLICLARAILQQNNILVLDEATASIDSTTDALIQRTIRDKFKDCTVLTVAHRLNTIMDSDKILVINEGEAVEYGNPYALLKQEKGFFFNMVQKTGKAMAQHLTNIAEVASTKLSDQEIK